MNAVATINLPWVQTFVDRHGHRRFYYRRPGYKRAKLPGVPGSAEFMGAYAEAVHGKREGGAGAERTKPRSIADLIVVYYASAEYEAKRDSTKSAYRGILDRFRDAHGDKLVRTVEPKHLTSIFDSMAKTPAAASTLRKRLRRLFRLAVRLGWRDSNPVAETDAPKLRSAGFTPWSEADIAAYRKRWPTGSRERLALELLLCTGQRRSDIVGMGRQHVRAGRIHVKQIKTGTLVAIKLHPSLKAEIDAAPPGMTFVMTKFGRPFTAAGFTAWFRERAEMAGLVGRTPHGLRKAAGRRLAEAGCSAKQIAAVLGHKSLAEVERYTRDADQTILADAAMDALEAKS